MKRYWSQYRRIQSAASSSPQKQFGSRLRTMNQSELSLLVMGHFYQGKCCNLMKDVVSTPRMLLTAYERLASKSAPKKNLLHRDGDIQHRASKQGIDETWLAKTSKQLADGNFDIEANCFTISSSATGKSLVLPNLKLRVVMEAMKMVLDALFEPRFVTFAYGGRVGMGRHTALRYIKANVANPTWWFSVAFHEIEFDLERVQKLISFMQRKLHDPLLFELIFRLFRANVLKLRIGDFSLGRGFPQESCLCCILLNIYFDGFDHDIMYMRRDVEKTNSPRFGLFHGRAVTLKGSSSSRPLLNPVKLYVCRYLDDILVITSGSKELLLDLRKKILGLLEDGLKLAVNHSRSILHSAEHERIEFLGMHIQAVPPSKLTPMLSEKAKRARKKYLDRRRVLALEQRNARETKLKKMGMKILQHTVKKYKRSGFHERDPEIAPHIRRIFRSWTTEIVSEFLQQATEHRWFFHRKLSASIFLSSTSVRQRLPREVLDAYVKFQEKVDKYLNTDSLGSAEQLLDVKTEQKNFEDETVKDLTKLGIKLSAPTELIRRALRLCGFMNSMGRPQPIDFLSELDDEEVIRWYSGIAMRLLNYFCCCNNFKIIKKFVNYHMRFSCILTLAQNHGCTKRNAIRHYTKDLKFRKIDGNEETVYPSENNIKMMGNQNLVDPKPFDDLFCMTLVRRSYHGMLPSCSALCCDHTATAVYKVILLHCRTNTNPVDNKRWMYGIGTVHEAFEKKCLPLCEEHIEYFLSGDITLQDIDYTCLR